jgi:hypothetical protein
MKRLDKNQNPLILFFWSTPSCSTIKAYKKKSDLLNLAIKEDYPVEIKTKSNETKKLEHISIEAGTFFGIESIKGGMKKILLNINQIKMITIL